MITVSSTMAASILCLDLLRAPRTVMTTIYRGRDSWLLGSPRFTCAVSLLTPDAVLLPHSLVVGELPVGSGKISLGEGALWYDDDRVAVSRWFTPPRVARGALRRHGARIPQSNTFLGGWSDRLGAGEGLTPYGDDVICGTISALLATDHRDADPLAREIREADLEARTTPLSAALLRCASDGWCIPEVDRVLVGLASGRGVGPAVQGLLTVGHSSGRGLLSGLSTVLDLRHAGQAA